jgi:hypothetical protein
MSKPPRALSPSSTSYAGTRGGYTKRGSAPSPPAAMTTPKATGLATPTPRRQPSTPDKGEVPPRNYSGGSRD